MSEAVRTTCPYCGVGCGVLARRDADGQVEIAGDAAHPANFGSLCSKGSALGETIGLAQRLLHPMIDGERVEWDAALERVASGFRAIIDAHGPDSVAFYLSGQLLTEDYYVANKLMKGFIGSANVDTNSRLCMSSSVAGHKRAFGADVVPTCYEDIDEADLLVLVGSNAAWCHPVLYRRMIAAQERGAKIVVIDPRRTPTAESADLHLAVAPGADTALFSGLLVHLATSGALAGDFISDRTKGFSTALACARAIAPDVAATARATGLAGADVARFFSLFAETPKVVTLYSQGVNQSAQGTDKVSAILNCHLATGRIGKPGAGPLSLTGQPNAMGGREVGGLANQLAAHMHFEPESVDRVSRFWNAPDIARAEGAKAVDMFEAIAAGKIRALWVMGTNPVVSMPNADRVRAALGKLELFVVSDNVMSNDTLNAGPHVLLPALGWGEKSGTVTNSERRISRQRSFLPAPGEARADWRIICDVASRMGFRDAFAFASPADIFREHAALSAFENDGRRDFDLGALADLDVGGYDALAPVQWPVDAAGRGRARLFGDSGFFTPDGRAHFVAVEPPRLADRASEAFPLMLNTGRMRDQWHTMTRTGIAARLGAHAEAPMLSIGAEDAAAYGLSDGGFAEIVSAHGALRLQVQVTSLVARGEIFAPIHWSDETASAARVSALVRGAVDPFSGQPELKSTPVRVAPLAYCQGGFVLARARLPLPREGVWAWRAVGDGYAAQFASNDANAIGCCLDQAFADAERIVFRDDAMGVERKAWIRDGRLVAMFFSAPLASAPRWSVAEEAWRKETICANARKFLLAGVAAKGGDASPVVCACFGVSRAKILSVVEGGARDAQAIGAQLKAGTNCGSCLPELRKLAAGPPAPTLAAAE